VQVFRIESTPVDVLSSVISSAAKAKQEASEGSTTNRTKFVKAHTTEEINKSAIFTSRKRKQ
jgi:hypothetical protein